MSKINFMIFLSMVLAISYSQLSSKESPINHPRKLQEKKINETILLGFDNYSTFPVGYKNYSISFYTYFLRKNWDENFDIKELSDFLIQSKLNCSNKKQIDPLIFNCSVQNENILNKGGLIGKDFDTFDIVRFKCKSDLIDEGRPTLINVTTNFSKEFPINIGGKHKISTSFEFFKKNLLNLKEVKTFYSDVPPEEMRGYPYSQNEDIWNKVKILRNSTFLSKGSSSLKIKGEQSLSDDWDSENIELLTNSYGIPKKIPFSGISKTDNSIDEDRYFLESKGSINLQNNTDLNYALLNFTKKNKVLLLDFKEGEQSVFKQEKREDKTSSKGLSTGGIVAIIIPSIIVLLGVVGLVYFLSRSVVPPPQVKNAGNTTLGIGSSEAVVHQ